jgi:hypothetical protein
LTDFYNSQIPGGNETRPEAPGEAQVRLASWIANVLRGWPFKIKIYKFEEEALAKFLGSIQRRWPAVGKWGAPKK